MVTEGSDTRIVTPRRLGGRIPLILLSVAALAFPWVFEDAHTQHVLIMIFIYGLMALGWNIIAGYCGQISLGQAIFFGIGAYSTSFLFANFGITPWIGMLFGVAVSLVVAVGIGLPTLRLRGHYFAIATLVIGEITQTIFINWEYVGGATGIWIPIVWDDPWYTFQFHDSKIPTYYIGLAFLTGGLAFTYWMERSKLGLYFRAIRDEPDAASSLGVNLGRYKLLAFMIAATFASLAGSQFAQYILVIDPDTVFPLLLSILIVLMTMLGGLGQIWGPVVGAAVLLPISEATRIYFGGQGGAEDLMIYGFLIVIISVFYPRGLFGLIERLIKRRDDAGS
ncbi:MAG TPA: branched-chain amino acid ABC transporter permease [Gammaproteobacteria bacterium]|jgi:branched-chain amino acid transport system permease protein|nr:branched-chain amino acid ABC transporter permease [Gammaproteobacteria bacterium]